MSIISTGTVAMYGLPYMKSVFYEPMRTALDLNHTQLGNLLSIYGFVALLGYFPGGWLADKFSAFKTRNHPRYHRDFIWK